MNAFCEKNVNIAIVALCLLAFAELVMSTITGLPAVHTGTCIGAIAGVIMPTKE